MALAIFDLDNTLIAGDSDHAWGQFLVEKKAVDVENYRRQNDGFFQDYQAGKLDMTAYLEFAMQPLAQLAPETLTELHAQFMQEIIEPMMLPKAQALLEKHRSQDDFLLVITSTNRFVVEPICQKLGVNDLIATEPEMIAGKYTGKITGTPSFREGKVERLQLWLQSQRLQGKIHSLEGSFFYSDSINDLPLLMEVAIPVAVDPDDALCTEAQQRGWQLISLR